ncbi:glycosyltransferase [Psychromonas sp. 14N.309.X.WAT.B.A12]|jgi:L-malate glycosyltransferase|uniref:glycosyltransferase n=1 Tax=unclassified Psychromonas TaxID=2614957 RepID=UPI0025AFAC19|nr:glycosyltransferase [Psychromonas sp. 14N.309.X.WAT.B.A12]MDN2662792.1 glycosyltransferase [Psychromonas sp. 14N.309.X.WAT.B.A12]
MLDKKVNLLRNCYRWLLRIMLILHYLILKLFKLIPHKTKKTKQLTILATGTFYSDHWLMTHLHPMANADKCKHLLMVASTSVPNIDKVSGQYAPRWLSKIFGQVGARLLFFTWVAITKRPDVLVGFHLLLNGLFVVVLAKLIGAKSVYICGGGPREVVGGGVNTENRIFNKIGQPDDFIEKMLVKSVNEMDLVVSMGTSAIRYFKDKGVSTNFEIVPGGFDDSVFCPRPEIKKQYDLILIGRLSEVKRIDRFLESIQIAKKQLPHLNAVIVGDGPDKEKLQKLAIELGIADDVYFAGWQNNVEYWLQQSRCFVLTSDSEGLSQALIQAMMCGIPAINSDVGDLSDLIKEDKNGYLITPLTNESFANSYVTILSSENKLKKLSENAYHSTTKFSVPAVSQHWQKIYATFTS